MLASWVLLTDPFVNVFRSMAQPPCLALFTITLLISASLPAFICLAGGSHLLFLSLHILAACAVAITLSPAFVLEWFLKQNLPRGSLFFKAGRRFMPPFAAVQTQCSLPLLTPSDLQLPWGKPPLELLLSKCLSCYPLVPLSALPRQTELSSTNIRYLIWPDIWRQKPRITFSIFCCYRYRTKDEIAITANLSSTNGNSGSNSTWYLKTITHMIFSIFFRYRCRFPSYPPKPQNQNSREKASALFPSPWDGPFHSKLHVSIAEFARNVILTGL